MVMIVMICFRNCVFLYLCVFKCICMYLYVFVCICEIVDNDSQYSVCVPCLVSALPMLLVATWPLSCLLFVFVYLSVFVCILVYL